MKFFRATRELFRRAKVLSDLGFVGTMTERCPFEGGRWAPGSVYARGDERICIKCLTGWSHTRLEDGALLSEIDGYNGFNYDPRTMEEVGAKLYPSPQGFSLRPPGTITPA